MHNVICVFVYTRIVTILIPDGLKATSRAKAAAAADDAAAATASFTPTPSPIAGHDADWYQDKADAKMLELCWLCAFLLGSYVLKWYAMWVKALNQGGAGVTRQLRLWVLQKVRARARARALSLALPTLIIGQPVTRRRGHPTLDTRLGALDDTAM